MCQLLFKKLKHKKIFGWCFFINIKQKRYIAIIGLHKNKSTKKIIILSMCFFDNKCKKNSIKSLQFNAKNDKKKVFQNLLYTVRVAGLLVLWRTTLAATQL